MRSRMDILKPFSFLRIRMDENRGTKRLLVIALSLRV